MGAQPVFIKQITRLVSQLQHRKGITEEWTTNSAREVGKLPEGRGGFDQGLEGCIGIQEVERRKHDLE
jgi:hypothetical protein